MSRADNDRQRATSATDRDLRVVHRQLVDKALFWFAVIAPVALAFSLFRIYTHGWHAVYFFHIGLVGAIVIGGAFRKRLSYGMCVGLLLGTFLLI